MNHDACTVGSAISAAERLLDTAGVDGARLTAEALMALLLGMGRAGVYARLRDSLDAAKDEAYTGLVRRRANREPLQYITGRQEFCGLDFIVGPEVLVPRPETEMLVTEGSGLLAGAQAPVIADIGTGSGCVAVSLAVRLPGAKVYAVDSSHAALVTAEKNSGMHGVTDRVRLLSGDIFSPMGAEGLAGGLDLIVSNPPYIPSGDIQGLQQEVLFEPRAALDGGLDGLDVFRRLIVEAPAYLKPGGWLLIEIGLGQSDAVRRIVDEAHGLELSGFKRDFSGIERVLVARRV